MSDPKGYAYYDEHGRLTRAHTGRGPRPRAYDTGSVPLEVYDPQLTTQFYYDLQTEIVCPKIALSAAFDKTEIKAGEAAQIILPADTYWISCRLAGKQLNYDAVQETVLKISSDVPGDLIVAIRGLAHLERKFVLRVTL